MVVRGLANLLARMTGGRTTPAMAKSLDKMGDAQKIRRVGMDYRTKEVGAEMEAIKKEAAELMEAQRSGAFAPNNPAFLRARENITKRADAISREMELVQSEAKNLGIERRMAVDMAMAKHSDDLDKLLYAVGAGTGGFLAGSKLEGMAREGKLPDIITKPEFREGLANEAVGEMLGATQMPKEPSFGEQTAEFLMDYLQPLPRSMGKPRD